MAFKLNISHKGKSWKMDTESESLVGKSLGENLEGKDVSENLHGYEFEITGASDIAGFPHKQDVEGPALRRVLLKKGWGMRDNTEGMRRRKTVRGKQLSEKTVQINLKVKKEGSKSLVELFPDQNKPAEAKAEASA